MLAFAKNLNTPRSGAQQNDLFRTNRTPLARSFVAQALLPVLPIADRSVPETKLRIMNTSANRARNPRRMSSSVFKDLNPLGMSTYRKNTRGGCGPSANHHLFSATAMHARPPCGTARTGVPGVRRFCVRWGGRSGCATRILRKLLSVAECALTQNRGGGGPT